MNHLSFPHKGEGRLCPCTAVLSLMGRLCIIYTGHISVQVCPVFCAFFPPMGLLHPAPICKHSFQSLVLCIRLVELQHPHIYHLLNAVFPYLPQSPLISLLYLQGLTALDKRAFVILLKPFPRLHIGCGIELQSEPQYFLAVCLRHFISPLFPFFFCHFFPFHF